MAKRQSFLPGYGYIVEEDDEESFLPGYGYVKEDQADVVAAADEDPYIPIYRRRRR